MKCKLLPIPQSVRWSDTVFHFPADGVCYDQAACLPLPALDVLTEAIHLAGGLVCRDGQPLVSVKLGCNKRPEWYRLTVTESGIAIEAGSTAGAQHAAVTLRQIARQSRDSAALLGCVVEDWPDITHRGIMLDISREKVPTMESLFSLVEMMVELKLNEFQLYTEHTFAYQNDGKVWRQASPISGEEIQALDAFCKARHIDLVPNQNSFGHLTKWLDLPEYIGMAEAPDGFDYHWGTHSTKPFSLCPIDPQSIEFIGRLYDELLPNFSSEYFNVGCDETHDIGQGKSKEAVEKLGSGRVYLDFLLKVHDEVRKHGRRMMFWGDMIIRSPEFIPEIPRDIIGLVWGYSSTFPFDEQCEKYKKTGLDFYVCPGVATWQSFCGRTDNMIANVRRAAESAVKWRAKGFLNTDWGDLGHHQPAVISWLGYSAGAAATWAFKKNKKLDITASADLHVFKDSAHVAAKLLWSLGNTYRLTDDVDCTKLFQCVLWSPTAKFASLDPLKIDLVTAHVNTILKRVLRLRLDRPDADIVRRELRLACHFMLFAAAVAKARSTTENGTLPENWAMTLTPDTPTLEALMQEHRDVWLLRNRPGGLGESIHYLAHLKSK